MRKIFGGAMLFSALGAVVLGGALAWNQTFVSAPQTNTVGNINFTATVFNNGSMIGPNNGQPVEVAGALVANTGNFDLRVQDARVEVFAVTGAPACSTHDFSYVVNLKANLLANGGVLEAPPGGGGDVDGFEINLVTLPSASAACQGQTVSWVFVLTMETF